MAKMTKSSPKKPTGTYLFANIKDLNLQDELIEHIKNLELHLSEEEKGFLKSLMEGGLENLQGELLEHIENLELHFSEEEKQFIKDLMEGGLESIQDEHLEHIKNLELHFSEEEKEFIKNLMEGGLENLQDELIEHIENLELHFSEEEKEFVKGLMEGGIENLQDEHLEHIENLELHFSEEEKEFVKSLMEDGLENLQGDFVDIEKYEELLELINSKSDIGHDHSRDEGFLIHASQIIESKDRKFVSEQEKQALSGITDNIQIKLNLLSESMKLKGIYDTFTAMNLANAKPQKGDTVFVTKDETDSDAKTMYVHNGSMWLKTLSTSESGGSGAGWIASKTEPSTDVLWIDNSDQENIVVKWHNGLIWKAVGGVVNARNVIEGNNKNFVTDNNKQILEKLTEDSVTGGLIYDGIVLGGITPLVIKDDVPSLGDVYSSKKTQDLLDDKQQKLTYIPENSANKNKANGYPSLDSDGEVPLSQLPNESLHRTHVVKNSEERLELTLSTLEGDYCYENTSGKLYVKVGVADESLENYDAESYWVYISDAYKTKHTAINNLTAEINPTEVDSEVSGYHAGSVWINTLTKKSFICTDATTGAAQWDLIGGQVNLNANQIITFLFDETLDGRTEGQTRFQLPKYIEFESYIEVSKNGLELVEGRDYLVTKDENIDVFYIDLTEETQISDIINGEIYHADVDNVDEYMVKNIYDTNYNGIVDRAEVADSVTGLMSWESGKTYLTNNLILKDNVVLRAKSNFKSGLEFNSKNWEPVIATPIDLLKFTTDNLSPTTTRGYVTSTQLTNINKIPTMETNITNLKSASTATNTEVNKIKSYIPSYTDSSNKLVNAKNMDDRFKSLTVNQLKDTPSVYVANGFLKVNDKANGVEYISEPRFPIMKITDRRDNVYEDIYDLKIDNFEKVSFENGQLRIAPKLRSAELLDMPNIEIHGGILVSNKTLMQYDLIDLEELTLSQENFKITILEDQWVQVEDKYEFTVEHTLNSEALIISFTNVNKEENKTTTYRVVDDRSVIIISDTKELINVAINCSLGVTNGYWNHLFDISKITVINDKDIRVDKTYSSSKLEAMMQEFADKSLVYTKTEANNIFSLKNNDHTHTNYSILNKFEEDDLGNAMFNGKKLLTDIKGRTVSVNENIDSNTISEIINVESIVLANQIETILSSEIVIQNTSDTPMELIVKDKDVVLVNEQIPANGVQKYNLGISTGTIVSISGNGKLNYYISAL